MTREDATADADSVSALVSIVVDTLQSFHGVIGRLHTAVLADLARVAGAPVKSLGLLGSIEAVSVAEMSRSDTAILGLGFAAHPAVFGEPGLAWWHHAGIDKGVQLLGVRTKPGTIDFYDYLKTEWWRGSIEDDDSHVFGPYVDHCGTNAYVLTFARAVRHAGVLSGIVVLDVQVERLQSRWQAALLRFAGPCSVINDENVVIATNDSTLMADTLEPWTSMKRIHVNGTGWGVVLGRGDPGTSSPPARRAAPTGTGPPSRHCRRPPAGWRP